jgi:hypothetical protein
MHEARRSLGVGNGGGGCVLIKQSVLKSRNAIIDQNRVVNQNQGLQKNISRSSPRTVKWTKEVELVVVLCLLTARVLQGR